MVRFILVVLSWMFVSGLFAQTNQEPGPSIFIYKKKDLLFRPVRRGHNIQSIQVNKPVNRQSFGLAGLKKINHADAFYHGDNNTGYLDQIGIANTALIMITGDNNYTNQLQSGSHNYSSINIQGFSNYAETWQDGYCGPHNGNRARIFINGKGNYAGISQFNTRVK